MNKFDRIKQILEETECIHDWVKQGEDRKELIIPYANHPSAIKKYQYVLILSCKKCGKVDKTIEKI